ncbi:MAG: 4a-hydroxytetrahydrobiopterin dehydratase [Fuerstiella sp.]|nr:4a-hydroxytetrahydrobiopterin dehydratase [Fuerstiella sp.]MCP4853528.1 4a-hydroxytetrahydrobiopterin dehydratase [Fuerstiella sp.]
MSEVSTTKELCSIKCVPCEGGVARLTTDEAQRQLQQVDGWELRAGPDRITRSWTVKNFMAGLAFLDKVGDLAEDEGHHPDLHLVGYRNVTIDIRTHAIGGLSLNDFILAAKIDRLPIDEK